MPSTAAKRALEKPVPLTEAEALRILNAMPRLVAASNSNLAPGIIVIVAYEVSDLNRSFTFPEQPFRILRKLTFAEFRQSLPKHTRAATGPIRHYYEIHTD